MEMIALTTGIIGGRGNVVYGMGDSMKAIIFDAFGTLFKVTDGGSARTIRQFITETGAGGDVGQDGTVRDLNELWEVMR